MNYRLFTLLFCLSWIPVQALELNVSVQTMDSQPMAGAVVYLTSEQPLATVAEDSVATMDQVKKQFAPHILVVQKGTQIDFPNSDSIQHHVYSFSPAKTFQLQLYKDHSPDPLHFNQPGRVELGCNVHDWMVGYVFVVDTPYFGQSNEQGLLTLDVPSGKYTLHVRHPRIQDQQEKLDIPLQINSSDEVRITLENPLLPGLNDVEEDTDEFLGYE